MNFSPRKINNLFFTHVMLLWWGVKELWWCPGGRERERDKGNPFPLAEASAGYWRHGNARSSLVAARLAPHAELAPLLQPHSTHLTYFFCVFSRDYGPYSRCSNGRICLGRLWHKTFTPLLSPWQPLTEYLNFPGLRPYSSHSHFNTAYFYFYLHMLL